MACFWVVGAAVSRVFGRGVVFGLDSAPVLVLVLAPVSMFASVLRPSRRLLLLLLLLVVLLLDGTPLRFRERHSPARVPRGGSGAVRSITVAAAGARSLSTPRGVPSVRCRRCVVVFWLVLSVLVVVLVLVAVLVIVVAVLVAVDFVDLDLDLDVLPGIPHSSQREDAPSCSYVQ